MKVNYADYIKNTDVSVLVAEAIFSELHKYEKIRSIGDVSTTSSGGTPLRGNSDFYNGDIPWLKSGELNDGYIEKAEEFITEKGLTNSSAKLFPEGTLLLAMYGATAGKTGITKIKTSTNQAVCALFPKEEIKRDFLYWFLRQHRYKFIEISKGGAQPNISQTVINQTQIPIPDINVQERIISVLFSIQKKATLDLTIIPEEFKDAVVKVFHTKQSVTTIESEISHQLDLLKKLRQLILQDAVHGKLVQQAPNDEPASKLLERIKAEKEQLISDKKIKRDKPLPEIKSEEIPFKIPENWVWCRLGEICSKIGSGSTPRGSNYSNQGFPFFRSQNIHNCGLVYDDIKFIDNQVQKQMVGTEVKPKDLLLNITGGSLGRCAIVPKDFNEGNVSQHVCIIRPISLNNHFVHSLGLSPYFQKLVFESTTGAGREGLPKYNLEQFIIPIPPYSEQNRIVVKIDQLMKICDELEQSIQKNQKYTKELLQVALKEALEPKAI